jgi:hypothetical protein
MKLKPRKGSWILAVLFAAAICFPASLKASVEPGLDVTVYNNFGYNASPPLPDVSGRPVVGTATVTNINQNFDQSPMFNMYEDFIVKYEGYITAPITGDILFWPQADDGTMFYLDGILIDQGNWVNKGGGGLQTPPQQFNAGESKPFIYWYYEDGGGANTTLYWNIGNGWEIVPESAFSKSANTTTTTTIAPYFNPVTNLLGVSKPDASVDLAWDQPQQSNLEIFAYTITFFKLENGVESGGWGVWTDQISFTLGPWMWDGTTGYGDVRFKIRPGTAACFTVSNLECFYGPEEYIDLLIEDPTPTTTTTVPLTTTTVAPTTTTTVPPTTTTVPPTTTTVAPTTTTTVPPTTTTTVPPTTTTVAPTTTTTVAPTTTTTVAPTTTTTVAPTTTTVAPVIQIPELKTEEKIPAEQAVSLAIDEEVLQNIDEDEARVIFSSIETSSINEEQKSKITEAVQNAPQEVKEAFEGEINIYAEGFDDYVPVGSSIDVGTRRTFIAATTVLSTVAIAATGSSPPSGSGPSGSPKPSGGSSGDTSNTNAALKKEEEDKEEEEEEGPEIEGPEGDDEENNFTRNSIFKYQEGTMKKRFSPWGFIKKFSKETAAMAFTISGSVVVFATLSGETRKITLIATSCAFIVHYINAMLKNDE